MGGVDWEAEAVPDCEDELGRAEVEAEGLYRCAVWPVPCMGQREGSKPGPFPGVLVVEHGVEVVELLLIDLLSEHLLGETLDFGLHDRVPQRGGEGRKGGGVEDSLLWLVEDSLLRLVGVLEGSHQRLDDGLTRKEGGCVGCGGLVLCSPKPEAPHADR